MNEANLGCRRSFSLLWRRRCTTAEFADLRGSLLWRLAAPEADFWMADLRDTKLDEANLANAQLYGVNLKGASLRGTILSGAEVSDVTLDSADLQGADLGGLRHWRSIASMRRTNLAAVRNAPPGFIRWAIDTLGAYAAPSGTVGQKGVGQVEAIVWNRTGEELAHLTIVHRRGCNAPHATSFTKIPQQAQSSRFLVGDSQRLSRSADWWTVGWLQRDRTRHGWRRPPLSTPPWTAACIVAHAASCRIREARAM